MGTQTTSAAGSLTSRLASIHRRMEGVTEEEALAAIRGGYTEARSGETATVAVATSVRFDFVASEHEIRTGSALTQTGPVPRRR